MPAEDLHDPVRELPSRVSTREVLFKLTPPSRPNLYQPLMEHPRTLRVLALSGDYSRAEAEWWHWHW